MFSRVLALLFLIRLWCLSHNNVLEYLRNKHGLNSYISYRKWANCTKKLTKAELDLNFLQKCKIYQVTPKFLRFKLHRKSLKSANFYKKWQDKLLTYEIKTKQFTLKKLQIAVDSHEQKLAGTVSRFDMILLKRNNIIDAEDFKTKTLATHEKKLAALGVKQSIEPCDPDKVIFNYSSISIPHRVKQLLAFGLDFGLPVFNLDYIKYFFHFEKIAFCFKNLGTSEQYGNLVMGLKQLSHKFYYNFKPAKIFSILSKKDLGQLKDFAKNENIIITKPDKGRGVVVLNKDHYVGGMDKIITNSNKFQLITEDIKKFSRSVENGLNTYLLDLKKLGYLSESLYKRLHATGSGPGILYGLPKIHKINFKADMLYRPIFAAYNCASYNLSKFLVEILKPLAENQYTVKNSTQFRHNIENLNYDGEVTMVSFDIKDLYTNIPLSETLDIVTRKVDPTLLNIPKNLFLELLKRSVFNTFFQFNSKFYKQTDGLGMGLPLSPTLANIFLCHHELIWLEKCPPSCKPLIFRRYVDDTFAIF